MIFNLLGEQPTISNFLMDICIFVLILIFAPIIGGLLSGIDRVFTARLQGRQGPPLLQPFYDFIKLLGKESKLSSKMQLVWIGAYLFLTAFSLVFIFMRQDILVVVFLMGFAGICLVMSGFSVKSPYSHMGANRELLQILAYEPILILTAIGIYLHNGSFMLSDIFNGNNQPMLISMWPIFLALVIILTIKFRKSPFDLSTSHHAHQEVVKGVTTEISGEYYAVFLLAEWYEAVLLLTIVSLFWAAPIWIGIVIALAVFLLEMVIDNISARLTASWMIKYSWIITLVLCLTNIIYLFVKRGAL